MMYTFYEQTIFLGQFILLGMFIAIISDTFNIIFMKKKWYHIILEIILWFILIVFSSLFIIKINDGYLPLYFFIFFLVGYMLYIKLLQKKYYHTWECIKKQKERIIDIVFPIELFSYIYNKLKKIYLSIKKNIHEKLVNKKRKKLKQEN